MRNGRARKRFALSSGVALAITSAISVIALSSTASATDPSNVSFGLEGCRNDGTITLPDGNGDFICADSAYTDGNLGQGWNELDLVPFRVVADASNAAPGSQTYTVAVAVTASKNGIPGFDFMSAPVLNTALSDASCSAATVGGQQTTGTTEVTRYRLMTVTQAQDTTCVYDFYARLAVGSHNFPGSSLHAFLANQNLDPAGIGGKTSSIPPNEILPQGLDKDMTATQDSDHTWSVVKQPTPATVSFPDTCDPSASRQAGVSVTVTWTKLAANPNGPITVITHVYATNPASRTITVNVSDQIYSGTTALGSPATAGPINMPADTANILVLTHQTTVPSGTTNLNDIATATYTDTVTGVPVPGTTTATASATVQSSGVTLNDSATINDVESITGGLTFSVDSTSGASGSFDGGYVAGTPTSGSVSWTSASQSDSGSVTFSKTVYAASGSSSSGQLSDTATVNGADGFTTNTSAHVDLSSSALVSLTINKRRSPVTSEDQTFSFDVKDSSDVVVASPSITVPGNTAANVDTPTTVTGLLPGSYTVVETASGPYPTQSAGATITLPTCSGSVSFTNSAAPASARVQKVTTPTSAGNWTFTLTGPNGLSETLTNVVANAGYVDFASALQTDGGVYTITETAQTGYDTTAVSGNFAGDGSRVTGTPATRTCSFTLDLPADSGGVLSCTFTNTQRGTIIVRKATNPVGAAGSFTFTGDAAGSISDGGTITVFNLQPGTYTSTESDPTPGFDLTSIVCNDGASLNVSTGSTGTRTATFRLDPGETVTCTFTNRQRAHARVVKTVGGQAPASAQSFTFQLRSGASASSAGTILESGVANLGNGGVIDFATDLVPGTTYQLCEQMMPGWLTSLGPPIFSVYNPSGDNSVVCTDFTATAGELKVFNIDNTAPPGGMALTIGFWKNWSSCTGGKQKPTLDNKLLLAANAGTPITLGQLVLDPNVLGRATACQYAIRILNKSTITRGVKKSSDPLFNMAAQLLAADLNVVSGAGTCASATSAITQAHQLLVDYHFNGDTYSPKLTKADTTLANYLARQLDKYNNNLLC